LSSVPPSCAHCWNSCESPHLGSLLCPLNHRTTGDFSPAPPQPPIPNYRVGRSPLRDPHSKIKNQKSSIINHQSSIINHQSATSLSPPAPVAWGKAIAWGKALYATRPPSSLLPHQPLTAPHREKCEIAGTGPNDSLGKERIYG
jgi:hypothetical protein